MAEELNSDMRQYIMTSIGQHKEAFCVYMEQHAHTEMWGYPRLAKLFKKLAKSKTKHIEVLQERLEYFDLGTENLEYERVEWPRHDLQGMLEADLRMEQAIDMTARKGKARGVTEEVADPLTANMFTKIARTCAEESIEKIQAALNVIDETSIKMYRQNVNLE